MFFPAILFMLFFSAAMLSLWCVPQRGRMIWLPWWLFAGALTVCFYQGWMQPMALLWPGLLVAALWQLQRSGQDWWHYLLLTGVVVLSLALATHLLPGFSPIPVFAEQHYRNLDKACVAFVLLALLGSRMTQWAELRNAFSITWPFFVISPAVIFSLAWLLGGINESGFGIPQHFWLWAWGNLLVTCVAEELFFRGLLQRYLVTKWHDRRWGWQAALCLVSLLFGLVHIGGGMQFALLAAIAGLFYGGAYHLSGRIEIPILLHFFINLLYVVLRG